MLFFKDYVFLYEFLTTWVCNIRSACWKPPFQSLRLFCSERGKKKKGSKNHRKKLYVTSISFRAPPSLPGRFTGRRCASSPRNAWKLVPDPWSRHGDGSGWWPADGQLDEILVANWCCQQIRVFFFVLSFWSFCWILGVNLCWELV